MMEYVVIGLLVLIIVLMFFKKPDRIKDIVIDSTTSFIKAKESEIVKGAYNKLPKEVKNQVNSYMVAEIVRYVINTAIEVVETEKSDKK